MYFCNILTRYFVQGFYPTGKAVLSDRIDRVPEALLRAVVLAGSRQITGKVKYQGVQHDLPSSFPNYAIGFGLPVIDRALYMQGYAGPFANGLQITKPAASLPSFAAGATAAQLYQFRCGASTTDKSVHIVLTWTDPFGSPLAINQIVNDIDLVVVNVTVNGTAGRQLLGNNGDFPDTTNTVEKVALGNCSQGQVVKVAINPGRVVTAQTYAVVINGNVEMGSFESLAADAFTFDPKRFAPLPSSPNPPSLPLLCSASVKMQFIPQRSPLGANPTSLALTVASRRFSAALAMYMGVGLSAVNAAFLNNSGIFSSINLTCSCSSYICSSSTGFCYVTATDVASAMRLRVGQLVSKVIPALFFCNFFSTTGIQY